MYFYAKSTGGFYHRDVHGEGIPGDAVELSDPEYHALLEGQTAGNEIVADEQGRPFLRKFRSHGVWVPSSVSRFQARAALLQAGLLGDIETYMADPATDPFVRIAWQDAQEFRRNSPTVLSLQPLLGLTDGQLDDLFRFAATIEA